MFFSASLTQQASVNPPPPHHHKKWGLMRMMTAFTLSLVCRWWWWWCPEYLPTEWIPIGIRSVGILGVCHHHRHGQHHHPHQHHPQGKGQRDLVTRIANRGQYNSSFNSVCEIKRSSVNLIYIWFTLLFNISLSCEIRFVRILNMLRGQKLPPQLLFSVFSPAPSLAIFWIQDQNLRY